MTGLGVQEQAVYICDEGFVIDGLLVRICLDDGEWGGGNPTCTSEYANYVHISSFLLLYCFEALCEFWRERKTAGIS